MNTCPNCGIAGNNINCSNHVTCWGINPSKEIVLPQPIDRAHALEREKDLFAEIGRLNVLLNKRDKEFRELSVEYQRNLDLQDKLDEKDKEIERLKGLMPPDERGPGFVGQGSWSVYAEKVVEERDALREFLAGLREKGIIDQHNRPLPLEGHHKDCGHGKDGWSLCTCDELKKADAERISNQFQDLVKEGQDLRKEFDKQTAGMRGPPLCSKCGDTGVVQVAPNARGIKRCDCKKHSHHPECEYSKRCTCLGLYERDARNDAYLASFEQALKELVGDDQDVSEHKSSDVREIRTPEGKPLLPAAEFSAMRIEDNRERGLTECNFQRQTGRTTAMVLKALDFVKSNTSGDVIIEVFDSKMKAHVKKLLIHYANEINIGRLDLSRIFLRTPREHIFGVDTALCLRDNVFDDVKDAKTDRDPRQDLMPGNRVRFEIEGVIRERQTGGWIKDKNGNDFEPVQYAIVEPTSGNVSYVGFDRIIRVIGKEEE